MPDTILSNLASITGTYDDIPTAMESTAITTLIVDGLSIVKKADRETWVTGELTYTITVANKASYDYENPVLTDVLDPSIVTLVADSVEVDGVASSGYTYDSVSGTLTVPLSTIPVGGTAVITFRVQKSI